MPINTINKSLKLNKCSINEDVSTWIEQDIIVPDTKPDAIKIVSVVVTPYVNETELMQDKIKVTGNINYFVIYKVDDEKFNTRGLFSSFPYSEILELKGANKDMNVSITPISKNVIYSLPNERKIAIKTEIVFKTRLKKLEDVDLINKFDTENDIECKMCTNHFSNIIQTKKNIIASKEDFMLPKEAEDFFEILNLETKIKNTEYKESYNKIMIKGDIDIKIIYLAENSDETVKKVNTTIPFSAMVELENINDKSRFDIKYNMQNFDLRLNPDITSTKTMNASYQIEVDVTMYEDEEIEYVDDFYSQTRNLNYDIKNIDAVKQNINITKRIDIKENVTNILPPDTRILDYTLDTNYIMPKISNNNVIIEGNAKVILLLQDLNTLELESKAIDILISQSIDIDNINNNSNAYVNIINENINVIQSGQDIEARIQLEVNVDIEDTTNLNIVNNIIDEELDLSNLDSINIYIVKDGDTLWSIAKRYRTSVEKILKTNDIDDADMISVGQKILIIR